MFAVPQLGSPLILVINTAVVSLQVIQAVFFGICVLTDLSSLLTRGSGNQEQERQLKKLISLRDWMLAVLAFPVGVVSMMWNAFYYFILFLLFRATH